MEIYENDFGKHNGKVSSARILMVFRSIVSQLAKSNEKFIYGAVRQGGRARDFEEAIEWLVSAGMLNRVYNVSKMEHPLSAFDKLDQFKLFLFDTGLLKHMAGVDNSAILLKADYQFKGPLTENYVLQQLRGQFEVAPRYYSDKRGEIDFLLQNGAEIIPWKLKAARINLRRPSNAILPKIIRSTRYAFPNAVTAGTEKSQTFPFIWPEGPKSCSEPEISKQNPGMLGSGILRCLNALRARAGSFPTSKSRPYTRPGSGRSRLR